MPVSGIAADKLEAIFEPFFTTKDLARVQVWASARRLVRQTVWRRNYSDHALGEGSTFTIYLPKAEKAADGAEAVAIGAEAVMGAADIVSYVGIMRTSDGSRPNYSKTWATDQWVGTPKKPLRSSPGDELAFDWCSPIHHAWVNGVELATVIRERYPVCVVLTSGL